MWLIRVAILMSSVKSLSAFKLLVATSARLTRSKLLDECPFTKEMKLCMNLLKFKAKVCLRASSRCMIDESILVMLCMTSPGSSILCLAISVIKFDKRFNGLAFRKHKSACSLLLIKNSRACNDGKKEPTSWMVLLSRD